MWFVSLNGGCGCLHWADHEIGDRVPHMNELTKKPVADLTTDELGRAYVDRLLEEGVAAVETGKTVAADG